MGDSLTSKDSEEDQCLGCYYWSGSYCNVRMGSFIYDFKSGKIICTDRKEIMENNDNSKYINALKKIINLTDFDPSVENIDKLEDAINKVNYIAIKSLDNNEDK